MEQKFIFHISRIFLPHTKKKKKKSLKLLLLITRQLISLSTHVENQKLPQLIILESFFPLPLNSLPALPTPYPPLPSPLIVKAR